MTQSSDVTVEPASITQMPDSVAGMDQDPDLLLLAAWRGGDRSAADRLIANHYARIRRAVTNKVPPGAVDDLVGDVLLAVCENRDRFRAGATFKTYAMKITLNTICDYYRRRKPLDAAEILRSSIGELSDETAGRVDAQEKERNVLEALRSLGLTDQHLLELYLWENMTAPELALVFDCPEGTIRGRISRARKRLDAALAIREQAQRRLEDTETDLEGWARGLRAEFQPAINRLNASAP